MKAFILTTLLLLPLGYAQETCESLTSSIEQVFDIANGVIMTTNIMQGKREFAFSKIRLYKDTSGQWQSEMLEQRGIQRPEDSESNGDGAEPTFAFNCEGHELSQENKTWNLLLQEKNPDIPVKAWKVAFGKNFDTLVPLSVSGEFEARILLIPFRGSFNTAFSDWSIPVAPPDANLNR